MPGVIIHTLLGARLLDRWGGGAAAAPFPAADPVLRAAFLAGSIGPDMGMYPGGAELFSNLAHYVRSGELARALIRAARTESERAFAWGWATHVLADATIHPFINVAAGDARGTAPLTYADDPALHLAVEVGADGCAFARRRELGLPRPAPLPADIAGFVAGAYRGVYGSAVSDGHVRASLAAWQRWGGFSVAVAAAASARLYGRAAGWHGFQGFARRAVALGTGLFARGSRLHALTHPLRPSARAEGLIENALTEFPERFRELQRDELASLPDYNLDTGFVEEKPTYPLTLRTLDQLGKPGAGDSDVG
jgi:hypothetical protein